MQQRRSADAQQTEISDGYASSDSVHTEPLSLPLPVEKLARGLANMVGHVSEATVRKYIENQKGK